mmetsp:Transcript_14028/g.28065  ORF Transcript_14028/g.28065 Transcript_14028/m.28065 type:complete len:509 (-) Transcript_14028:673-2199(-)
MSEGERDKQQLIGCVVNKKWVLEKKLGSGSFGEIFRARDHQTDEVVAVKLEPMNTKYPQLIYESKVLRYLHSSTPPPDGIARVHFCGTLSDPRDSKGSQYVAMAMDLLGPSLEDVFTLCNRRFSLKTILMIADQMLLRVEFLHSRNFIHRDIKPDNFLVSPDAPNPRSNTSLSPSRVAHQNQEGAGAGVGDATGNGNEPPRVEMSPTGSVAPPSTVHHGPTEVSIGLMGGEEGASNDDVTIYMIDFGLVKRYRNPQTFAHIPYREHKNLTGTARYASINAHVGIEQSRRDDLEAIGYVLLYFCTGGNLPWQGLRANTKNEKYEKIMEKKMQTSIDSLCHGFPSAFVEYLRYVRELKFEEEPDYARLRKLFSDLFKREGYKRDGVWDWVAEGGRIKSRASFRDRERESQRNLHPSSARRDRGEKGGRDEGLGVSRVDQSLRVNADLAEGFERDRTLNVRRPARKNFFARLCSCGKPQPDEVDEGGGGGRGKPGGAPPPVPPGGKRGSQS